MRGKLPDGAEMAADGGRRLVAALRRVQHALAKWGQIIFLTSSASRVHTGWYVAGAEKAATPGNKAARS